MECLIATRSCEQEGGKLKKNEYVASGFDNMGMANVSKRMAGQCFQHMGGPLLFGSNSEAHTEGRAPSLKRAGCLWPPLDLGNSVFALLVLKALASAAAYVKRIGQPFC